MSPQDEADGGFRVLDHPADLGIEAWGRTLSEAFREAVHGLVALIVEPATVGREDSKPLSISAADPEQLLVRVLSEVLFLLDAEHFVVRQIMIDEMSGTLIHGAFLGEKLDPAKHRLNPALKAITYHQLSVTQKGGKMRAKFFVDV